MTNSQNGALNMRGNGSRMELDVNVTDGEDDGARDNGPLAAASFRTPTMRRMLSQLFEDVQRLDQRIAAATREVEALAACDDRARRLMTIPGIGPLAATALLAAIGDGRQFRRARDLAAWLGLVPREHSTGGKQRLLGISKHGNRYVRKLLIHGARSCVTHLDRTRDRLGGWLDGLQARMHVNKVTVALAAKIARMSWVMITQPGALYQRRDPVAA